MVDGKFKNKGYMYNKLGDSLKYALLHEIKNIKKDGFVDNYFAAVVYMYFHDLLTYNTAFLLQFFYLSMRAEDYSYEEMCDIIAMNLVDDPMFEEKIARGKSFEEILEDLNEYTIDPWILICNRELFYNIPQICLSGKMLFFFDGRGKDSVLMSICVDDICEGLKLREMGDEVSRKFICFVDPEIRTTSHCIYLKYKHTDSHFCKYNYCTDVEECYSGKLLGVAADVPVVAKEYGEEKWVEYSFLGQSTRVIRYEGDLDYIVKPTYMLVRSGSNSTNFIQPYRVYYSGEIKDCSDFELKQVLWEKLCPMLVCSIYANGMSIRRDEFILREKFKMTPDSFTVKAVTGLLDKIKADEMIPYSNRIAMLREIIRLISHCLNEDRDIIDILYVLMDISVKKDDKIPGKVFPSDLTFEGIGRLHKKGLLKEAVQDSGRLKIALHTELKLNIGEPKEEKLMLERMWGNGPMLGTFDITTEEFLHQCVAWEECIMFGNMLIPKNRKYEGIVTKDTNTGVFYFYYPRTLDSDERDVVVAMFDLFCQESVWIENK